MKKSFFAIILAVAFAFTTAVVTCVRALNAQEVGAFSTQMRIVVDAGHGGIDGGVTGIKTGVKESDLNLSIAFLLKEELEDKGFEVILTRKTEGGLYGTTAKGFKKRDMQKRKECVEEAQPQMLISVHQNFYPSHSTRGAQVFYSPKSEGSKAFAEGVQTSLNTLYSSQKVKGRGCKEGEFFMLECYPCPSVIVECGFLSNAKDEALLVTKSWQTAVAQAVAGGVLAYFAQATA